MQQGHGAPADRLHTDALLFLGLAVGSVVLNAIGPKILGRATDASRVARVMTEAFAAEGVTAAMLAPYANRPETAGTPNITDDALRLKPVADRLSQLLGRPVRMIDGVFPGASLSSLPERPSLSE